MSSCRSRSGGRWISIVLRRKSRSSRKRPAATSAGRSALVAERMRTSIRREREAPTRSTSPLSSTRSSLACCRGSSVPISSSSSVPPSASSNRPMRSVRASVNAPFTWPNISLSNSPSESPPRFTATSGRAARGEAACTHWATTSLPVPCSPRMSTLASDGATRSMSCSTGRMIADSAMSGGRPSRRSSWFSPSSRRVRRSARPELDLGPERGEQPGVVPRLLDEVAGAAAHRLDGLVDAAPGRHDDGRQGGVERLELGDQLEALAAGGGVAGVVEVEQDGVEVGPLHGGEHGGRRGRRLDGVAFALEQEPERLADVGLVVRDEDAAEAARNSTTGPGRWNRGESNTRDGTIEHRACLKVRPTEAGRSEEGCPLFGRPLIRTIGSSGRRYPARDALPAGSCSTIHPSCS